MSEWVSGICSYIPSLAIAMAGIVWFFLMHRWSNVRTNRWMDCRWTDNWISDGNAWLNEWTDGWMNHLWPSQKIPSFQKNPASQHSLAFLRGFLLKSGFISLGATCKALLSSLARPHSCSHLTCRSLRISLVSLLGPHFQVSLWSLAHTFAGLPIRCF